MDNIQYLAANGISVRSLRLGQTYSTCPKCSHTRKKKKERCLSVLFDGDGVTWYCHHCGWTRGSGTATYPVPAKQRDETPPARFASVDDMHRTSEARSGAPTAFCVWLESIFGWAVSESALDLYNVGRSREGHTVFWLVDCYGRPRQPRITSFGEDGNSNSRSVRGFVPEGFRSADGFSPCMFGEHLLLAKPKAPVVYVEAEKTAVVGECLFPEAVWVSINGTNNWKRAAACPHNRGRVVLSMFDPDEAGRKAEASLRGHIGPDVLCYQGIDTWPGADKETTCGYNLADYVYNPYGGEMVINCEPELRVPAYGVPALFEAVALLESRAAKLFEN